MDVRVLSLNAGHKGAGSAAQAQAGLRELFQREDADVIALQECAWTASGTVLRNEVLREVGGGGRQWEIAQVWAHGRRYNTIIYDDALFTGSQVHFEDLGINLEDGAMRRSERLQEEAMAPLWKENRYIMVRLQSRRDESLSFYIVNWHGPHNGTSEAEACANTTSLLERVSQLVEQERVPAVICGDFNYALGDCAEFDEPFGVAGVLCGTAERGISFSILNHGLPTGRDVADARFQEADQHAAQVEAAHSDETRVRRVEAVAVAWQAREEARMIRDRITKSEIDFICSMQLEAEGCDTDTVVARCTGVQASYVTVHAGFDHAPVTASFTVQRFDPAAPPQGQQLGTNNVVPFTPPQVAVPSRSPVTPATTGGMRLATPEPVEPPQHARRLFDEDSAPAYELRDAEPGALMKQWKTVHKKGYSKAALSCYKEAGGRDLLLVQKAAAAEEEEPFAVTDLGSGLLAAQQILVRGKPAATVYTLSGGTAGGAVQGSVLVDSWVRVKGARAKSARVKGPGVKDPPPPDAGSGKVVAVLASPGEQLPTDAPRLHHRVLLSPRRLQADLEVAVAAGELGKSLLTAQAVLAWCRAFVPANGLQAPEHAGPAHNAGASTVQPAEVAVVA